MKPAEELADLDARIAATEAELPADEAEATAAEAAEAEELRALQVDLALGRLDEDEYETAAKAVRERTAEACRRLDRQSGVLGALRGRAAELAEAIAEAVISEVSARVEVANARAVLAASELAARQSELAAVAEELAETRQRVAWASAPYDDAVRSRMIESDRQDAQRVRALVNAPEIVREHELRTQPLPQRLRRAVDEGIVRLREDAEQERERTREAARRSWEAVGLAYPYD
jgi:hypothetical protein